MRRRDAFLSAAAMLGIAPRAESATVQPLPDPGLASRDPDKYWLRIRRDQFVLPEARAFLNNGSLGVAPRPVLNAIAEFLHRSAAMALPDGEYPRWGYETLDKHRDEMAAYLGCKRDNLAFTHNATEAMSMIANGIDLKAGDEVVMTDQEHGSGKNPWLLKKARVGIDVREVAIPLPPPNPDDVADRLVSALGPRTRVLFFSAITTTTGLVLPVRKICDAARAKGVLTVVDGAHLNGQVAARIDDLGCDFYAGSPHKWMFAPAGCGILWIGDGAIDKLWPTIVTGGWNDLSRPPASWPWAPTTARCSRAWWRACASPTASGRSGSSRASTTWPRESARGRPGCRTSGCSHPTTTACTARW
jgi:selenocysteine lyase/cysteine desulfurase